MREIIVIGDIEMGAGTLTDDFISDRTLSKLIISLSKNKHPTELILNGDTFDFLKCPYIDQWGKKSFPRHITKEISVTKLRLIHKAHSRVFEALRTFAKKHKIIFTIGNHDEDLFYRAVQEEIKIILGNSSNLFFKTRYRRKRIQIEHGHRYDLLMRTNLDKLFVNYKGVSILNVSWISFGLISKFLYMKEENPFIERIKPTAAVFSINKRIAKKIGQRSLIYLFNSILYYPFRYFSDPTYSIPRTLLREFYYRLRNVNFELDDFIDMFKKNERSQGDTIYVFGHMHNRYIEDNDEWTILQPDTWRDEYFFNTTTRKLHPKKKHYVIITIDDNNNVNWEMKTVDIKRKVLDIDEVIKNQVKFVREAAKEEGYISPFFKASVNIVS